MKAFVFPHVQFNRVNDHSAIENFSVINFDTKNFDSSTDLIAQYAYAQSKLINSLDDLINSIFSSKIDNSSLINAQYAIMKLNEAQNDIHHEINVLKNDVLPHIKDNTDSEEQKRCTELESFIKIVTHPTKGDRIDLDKVYYFIKFCCFEVSPNFVKAYIKDADFFTDIHRALPY